MGLVFGMAHKWCSRQICLKTLFTHLAALISLRVISSTKARRFATGTVPLLLRGMIQSRATQQCMSLCRIPMLFASLVVCIKKTLARLAAQAKGKLRERVFG